eukprot:NODE_3422_length_788_cov_286.061392.p3 GENE.NODE_3422_length_788_cov_286.061392~~NODE_3422_length_788_cov_286.061392.p3  ORF type:complete len:172 (-),score=59.36 NODE_3422_length_788_cov_286.061392:257-712(-)
MPPCKPSSRLPINNNTHPRYCRCCRSTAVSLPPPVNDHNDALNELKLGAGGRPANRAQPRGDSHFLLFVQPTSAAYATAFQRLQLLFKVGVSKFVFRLEVAIPITGRLGQRRRCDSGERHYALDPGRLASLICSRNLHHEIGLLPQTWHLL